MTDTTYSVTEEDRGQRLDLFLARRMKQTSRALVQRWIEDGSVLLNGKRAKAGQKLHTGDSILVRVSETSTSSHHLEPWNFPLAVLHEDEHLLAINKPSGLVTHPGAGVRTRTVANAAVALRPEIQNVGHSLRPGIVHRLDKETSGVLLIAKTAEAYYKLSEMFKERKIDKHYRALAYGKFEQQAGRVDTAIGRDRTDRKKISARTKKSRPALTEFHVLKQFDFAALLDVHILTGRTHQIRVHLTSINHPIVGDLKYGGGNWARIQKADLRAELSSQKFFGLHALSLSFLHPLSGQSLKIEAPLPEIWSLVLS